MEYKNQTENRAFQEMLHKAAVKRLQNRSGEESLLQKRGCFSIAAEMYFEIMSFMKRLKFNFLNSILTQT